MIQAWRGRLGVCVCVVSQFDLSITKQNYLFVRCQFLSHIPTKHFIVNLMMGVELDDGGKHDKTNE